MQSPNWRYILHADLDAFYASVEQRDNPEIRGKPVVVGGPPETRGVVAAASYEARRYGIHSAMPMRTAVRLCSELVRVSPRFSRYREVSAQIMAIFLDLTPLVEPLSLDEAHMDISGQVPQGNVTSAAQALKVEVTKATGLAVTIGGGTSKTVAKIASQVAKPDGLLLIRPGEERRFLDPLGVDMLWGVGPKTADLMKEHGINIIGQLAACDDGWLRQTFGRRGAELKGRALGVDNEQVKPHRETKSVSAETTMAEDLEEEDLLFGEVERLARRVSLHLQREGLKGKTVRVKIRLADFTTYTRQSTLFMPTDQEQVVYKTAAQLLRQELKPGRKFRLLGVGVGNFQTDFQLSLQI